MFFKPAALKSREKLIKQVTEKLREAEYQSINHAEAAKYHEALGKMYAQRVSALRKAVADLEEQHNVERQRFVDSRAPSIPRTYTVKLEKDKVPPKPHLPTLNDAVGV